MKIYSLIFLISFSTICFGQKNDSAIKAFSEKWKADSLGENGFRATHLVKNGCVSLELSKHISFNNIRLDGYSDKDIVNLLGLPNVKELDKGNLEFTYYTMREKCEYNHDWCGNVLFFHFDVNNIIYTIASGGLNMVIDDSHR